MSGEITRYQITKLPISVLLISGAFMLLLREEKLSDNSSSGFAQKRVLCLFQICDNRSS